MMWGEAVVPPRMYENKCVLAVFIAIRRLPSSRKSLIPKVQLGLWLIQFPVGVLEKSFPAVLTTAR